MSLKRFRDEDLLHNTVEARPKQSFFICDGSVYESQIFPSSSLGSYSFITKDGNLTNFRTVSTNDYNNDFAYGDIITGSSYIFVTSSLTRYHFAANSARFISGTLKNTFDYYKTVSPHHAYSSSLGQKETQELTLINIPAIYYGSRIEKGTVDIKMYISGSLVGRLQDIYRNGELVQTQPEGSTGSGSVAGVCLYREGFLALTGAWALSHEALDFNNDASPVIGKWTHFAAGMETAFGSGVIPSASFSIDFEGKTKIPTLTMFCHAEVGEFNHSNNPTFIEHGQSLVVNSSSYQYREPHKIEIANTVKTNYLDPTGSFEKTTYISSVKIYDRFKNLVGIAKLAKPIRKTESRDLTVKLRIDL